MAAPSRDQQRASGATSPVVALRGVTKHYGEQRAVDGVDLEVPPGICFGLLGPNGAGKTTTLRMTYGVTPPTSGSVEVFGIDVTRRPRAVRRRLGVTLQENALIEELTPAENLRVFGRYHLARPAEINARIEHLLDFLELRSHAHLRVAELSGGFQRRLAIALSLMNDPELLILDEPTTGLDPAVRLSLWTRVRELRSEGATVLLTTHYMDEAERLCDRLAVMDRGRVVAEGAPAELIRKHLAPDVLEIDVPAARQGALLAELGDPIHLQVGARLVIYADDAAVLLERVRHLDGGLGGEAHPILRRTNLEDVFLRITGTRLEEGA